MSKQTRMHLFMEYYSAMKKMEQLIHVTVCIALRALCYMKKNSIKKGHILYVSISIPSLL